MNTQRWVAATSLIVLFFSSLAIAQEDEGKKRKHQKMWELFSSLSGEERTKLHAAREQAMKNSAVQAAKQRRDQAEAEYRELLDGEMLKTDPSLKPVLEALAELKKRGDF